MNTGRVIRIINIPEPKEPQQNPQPKEQPIPVPNWPVKKPEKVPAGAG